MQECGEYFGKLGKQEGWIRQTTCKRYLMGHAFRPAIENPIFNSSCTSDGAIFQMDRYFISLWHYVLVR